MVHNTAYPKIEYYLYHYEEMKNRINNLQEKNEDIDYNHFNYNMWIRTKKNRGNSLENQIVKKINNECKIKKLNAWKNLISEVLGKLKDLYPLKYDFVYYKYFKKLNEFEIEEKLKINKYKQRDIRAEILHYIFLNCVKKNILKEVKQ